jgi:hypothetical protein
MAFLNVAVHDAEVTGVRMDREKMFLQLELVLHTRETVWFDFHGAEEWSLSGLGTRNVLSDIREWRAGMAGTAERCAECALDAAWTQKVLAGELALYVFKQGYVLARAVTIKTKPVGSGRGRTAGTTSSRAPRVLISSRRSGALPGSSRTAIT